MRIPSEGRGLKEDASGRAGASPNWREVGSILLFSLERKHYLALTRETTIQGLSGPVDSHARLTDASRSEAAVNHVATSRTGQRECG